MAAARNSPGDMALMEGRLRMNPAFASWPREAMNRLLLSSYVSRHTAGSVLPGEVGKATETLVIVVGHAMVIHSVPGSERFIARLSDPGELIGVALTAGSTSRVARALSAYTDVTAIHMPSALILETLDQEPALWKDMVSALVRQHAAHLHALGCQTVGSLRRCAVATIERLAALYGTRSGNGSSVRLQVSQTDLAMMLQANRQTVNRELKAIAATGAIRLEYGAIEVLDLDALRSSAPPRSARKGTVE